MPGFAGGVPHHAADLVQGVAGPFDDVERVQADLGVRAGVADRVEDPVGAIGGDQLDPGAALRTE